MKRLIGLFTVLFLLLVPGLSYATSLPATPAGPVLTLSSAVSDAEAKDLGRELGRYAPEEYKVLFLDGIGDEGPKAYADAVFEAWQLNARTALIVVAIDDRWVQVRVGDELVERGVDTAFLNQIVDDHFAPLAKKGDYPGAVRAIAERINRQADAGPQAVPPSGPGQQPANGGSPAVAVAFLGFIVAVALGVIWLVRRSQVAEQRRRLAETAPLGAALADRFVDLSLEIDLAREGSGETAKAFTEIERLYLSLSERYQAEAGTLEAAAASLKRGRTVAKLGQLGQNLRQLKADLDGFEEQLAAFARHPEEARSALKAQQGELESALWAIVRAGEALGFALPLEPAVTEVKLTLSRAQAQLDAADPVGAKGTVRQAEAQVKALGELIEGFHAASAQLTQAEAALAGAQRDAELSLKRGYALSSDPLAALVEPQERLAQARQALRSQGLAAFATALERFEIALKKSSEIWRPHLEGDRLSSTFATEAARQAAELRRAASGLRDRLTPLQRRFKGWQAGAAPDELLGAALALEGAVSAVDEARARRAFPDALRLIEEARGKVAAAREAEDRLQAELKEAYAWGERLSQELPRLRQALATLDGQLGKATAGPGGEARQAIDQAGRAIARLASAYEQPPADLTALPALFATASSEVEKAEAAMAKVRAEQQRLAEELRKAEQRYGSSPEARRILGRARGGLDMWDFILVNQMLQQAQRAHRSHQHRHSPTGTFRGPGGGKRGGGGGSWGKGNSGGGGWGGGGGRGNSGGGGW